jgi:DNA-binding transcriptional LysR family regulator
MRFDLFDLRLFIAVAEAGNLTRAARAMHIVPPAVSVRIKRLEEVLGAELFQRESTGVRLTPAGQAAVGHARRVLAQVSTLADEVARYGRGAKGLVRVHAVSAAVSEYLPEPLAQFLVAHADVNVEIEEHISDEIIRAIREEEADIGIIGTLVTPHELQVFPYVTDHLVVVTPPGHALAFASQVWFEEALGFDYIGVNTSHSMHVFLSRQSNQVGKPFRLRASVRSWYEVSRLVAMGAGISVMEQSAAHRLATNGSLAIVPLADPWSRREFRICVRDLEVLPACARDLVEALRVQSLGSEDGAQAPLSVP